MLKNLIVLELFVCFSNGFQYMPGGQGVIGQQCHYDDDCFMEHSYCENRQYCECRENFIASEDLHSCIAIIGATCMSKYDCESLKHSSCTDGHCFCDHGYIPNAHNTECLKVVYQIKGGCIQDNQCQEGLGEPSICHRQMCECLPHHHFDKECIRNKGLNEQCKNDSQCYIDEEHKNTLECLRGICQCKYGYYNFDGNCISTGGSQASANPWNFYLLLIFCLLCIQRYF